jgi:hypothetical protein
VLEACLWLCAVTASAGRCCRCMQSCKQMAGVCLKPLGAPEGGSGSYVVPAVLLTGVAVAAVVYYARRRQR